MDSRLHPGAPEEARTPGQPVGARPDKSSGRRYFLKECLCVALGALAAVPPAIAGLMTLLDPLRRKAAAVAPVKVTTLAALPDDGVPRKFPVVADRVDAWNKFRDVPIGAVYLRRTRDGKIEALNVLCPHAGCFVDYSPDRAKFICPCHNSSFSLDGKIADAKSPSPRPLDTLPVEVRSEGEIWVTFQNFQAGCPEKAPLA